MGATALVGVVAEIDIALEEPAVGVLVHNRLNSPVERAEEDRKPGRLGRQAAVRIEDASREVVGLEDDRVVGTADKRDLHLPGDTDERMTDDLELDRIAPPRHRLASIAVTSITSSPRSALRQRAPGGRMVVAPRSAMIAGPLIRFPARRRSRR